MSKLQQETAYERVEREDLVLFVNACFACTSQREFYGSSAAQSVSIAFLHDYILGNYRQLYVRMLAVGVNHFNQSQIILRLLAAGAPAEPHQRREESALLTAALHALPASAVFRLFSELARRRVNNRRSRALIAAYLRARPDPNFDAVKYRAKLSTAARHAHLRLGDERGTFLFALRSVRAFETPLFEQFRQAHYSGTAIFDLPFTVAEGLAAKKGLDQGAFLERIAPKMSAAEKLRMQTSAARHGAKLELDLRRAPLTRLAVYVLSLSLEQRAQRRDELAQALRHSARRAVARHGLRLGKVAAVLDCSYSSSGSGEKRRRPLAIALAVSVLLRMASREYRAFWTNPLASAALEDELMVQAQGQTALAEPLLDALEWLSKTSEGYSIPTRHRVGSVPESERMQPDWVIIVSDGYENDPPGAFDALLRVFRSRVETPARLGARTPTHFVHANPVFDAEHFAPKPLGRSLPTVGLRNAEDLPMMLGFARFADGSASLAELQSYLEQRCRECLQASLASLPERAEKG